MKFSINDSIIKKIASIIALSVLGFVIISFLSVVVLNTVKKIGSLSDSERNVTVNMYNAALNFERFVFYKDSSDYDKFASKIDRVIYESGSMGSLYKLLEKKSIDEIVEYIANKEGREYAEERRGFVQVVSLLRSNEVMKSARDESDKYSGFVKRYLSCAKKYKKSVNESEKRELLKEIASITDIINSEGKKFSTKLKGLSNLITTIMTRTLFGTIIAIIAIILIYSKFVIKSITKPLNDTVSFSKIMAVGDFTNKLNIKNKDELGQLATEFNKMVSSLKSMIGNVSGGIKTLSSSSTGLFEVSNQMNKGSQLTFSKSESVTNAAQEMSANITSVAAAMEQTSTNINIVATAAEEMTATIYEIAKNSERASVITGEAVDQVDSTSTRVNELGNAAQDIGKVTETITEISEQTNLLALNATIEAARAGESGKGFAVVASEIKSLANQTADATLEIKDKIKGIQDSTSVTVIDINKITGVIDNINEIVSTIASAVEEQSITTREISNNVSQASYGINEVNEKVSSSSVFAEEISTDIQSVNQATNEMKDSSSLVNENSEELSNLATQLKEMIEKFKI